jgi:hypothetical protein
MVKTNTIQLVFVAFPLSTQHQGEGAKTCWLGIGIMCPSGTTCLHSNHRGTNYDGNVSNSNGLTT